MNTLTSMNFVSARSGYAVVGLAVLGIALFVGGSGSVSSSGDGGTPSTFLFTLTEPSETGIRFTNRVEEGPYRNILRYQNFYDGGGVAAGDVNGDGRPDLYFTGNLVENRLYINRSEEGGPLRFEDVTEEAGVGGPVQNSWCTGTTMIDINADGHLDIYVARSGKLKPENRRNLLYINNGDGTFTEKAAEYGVDHPGYTIHAAFLDYDRDGDLDMYLLNNGPGRFSDKEVPKLKRQRSKYSGDKLLENKGGHFENVTAQAGIESTAFGFGLGVAVRDFNNDGWDDLYVSNDFFEHDYLYFNNQDGTFTEKIHEATGHISNASMGNDVADINRDGYPDLFVADMLPESYERQKANMSRMGPEEFRYFVESGYHYQYRMNTLQLNDGREHFSEIARMAGVSKTGWSWAPLFGDYNNDGRQDLYVTNGIPKDILNKDFRRQLNQQAQALKNDPGQQAFTANEWRQLLEEMPSKKLVNYMFENEGKYRFAKRMQEWGLDEPTWSTGAAYADLEGDGDLDLIVNNINERSFVYENHASERTDHHYLRVRLEGPASNPTAQGAKLRVQTQDGWQYRQLFRSIGFHSSVEGVFHVGLGTHSQAERVVVDWPDGQQTRKQNVAADQELVLDYENATKPQRIATRSGMKRPLFQEYTFNADVQYRHRENNFDDFKKRQSLLPHKMSRFGPGLATGDVNGDGLEDFFVGGAAGQSGALFFQKDGGQFQKARWSHHPGREDLGAKMFDADGDGDLDLYVVSGGNAYESGSRKYQDRLYLNDGQGGFSKAEDALPPMPTSGSEVAVGDMDGDGDADLFVGGRHVPGQYPDPPRSYILRNDGGQFRDVTSELAPQLEDLGMVTDATWTDYDGDGDLDLLVVGTWMPVTILENTGNPNGGRRFELRRPLQNSTGWWFSVTAADYDGDGDDDYVLGNMGLNYSFQPTPDRPFRVYAGAMDEDQEQEIVLSHVQNGNEYPVRGRRRSVEQLPALEDQFPTFDGFASATVSDVYGSSLLSQVRSYEAQTFASVYLENEGNGSFSRHRLPRRAQFSNINDALARDIDGNGTLDLVVAGNLYETEVRIPRNDASLGLYLSGDGTGDFTPHPLHESGFLAPRDVKDLAWVETPRGPMVLVANNNDFLQVIRVD